MEFIDERFDVAPDDVLTFGRNASVVIDEANLYMHRIVGSFVHHERGWWLRNDGATVDLGINYADGRSSRVPPGAAEPLVGSGGIVRFRAGASNYELEFHLHDPVIPPPPPAAASGALDTQPFGALRLNDDQRLLLTALAEPWLVTPPLDAPSIAANAEIAQRLGWSLKKLERKLDYLCGRLSELGVPGLRGNVGVEAKDRRLRLVEHALAASMVDARDLAALAQLDDGARR
ncbi:MAG: hypothetical protein R2733_25760 [Acidimicrobiales bacterium]